MEALITGALASALERRRADYNERFLRARTAAPHIDPDAFSAHLRGTLAPIVEAAERDDTSCTDRVTASLFDLSLELFASDLLGARARYPAIPAAWTRVLPRLPRLLRLEPRRVAGSVTNAVFALSVAPGARPEEWIAAMAAAAPRIEDLETLLAAGRVAAWRAGMAHLRDTALSTCRTLPPGVAAACLALPREPAAEELAPLLDSLARDPWSDPAQPDSETSGRALRLMRHVGEFRGFGGTFRAPPRIEGISNGRFLVRDGDGETRWALWADRFGASLLPAAAAPTTAAPSVSFRIDRKGRVTGPGGEEVFDALSDCTSFAATASTLAVTIALSHSIYIVAAGQTPPAAPVRSPVN